MPDELEPMRRVETVEMLIDAQLQDLHKEIVKFFNDPEDESTRSFVAALLRAAYGRGLTRGIHHPIETIKMIRALGFSVKEE